MAAMDIKKYTTFYLKKFQIIYREMIQCKFSRTKGVKQSQSEMDTFVETIKTKETSRLEKRYNYRQYLLATACFLQSSGGGAVMSFSSVFLAQLDDNKEMALNTDQISWLAAAPTMSMIPVELLTGWILNLIGRRRTFALTFIVTTLSWIALYFSNTYTSMFLSRLAAGIILGLCYPTMIVYLGEVTHPKIRPQCLTSIAFGFNFGIFITQLLGNFLYWRTLALLISMLPLCGLLILPFAAESYIWLLNKNRVDDARSAFAWYRGQDYEAKAEFLAVLESKRNAVITVKEKLKICFSKAFIFPFLVTGLLHITSEFSGDGALIFYTSTFIKLITSDPSAQFFSNSILNLLRVIATVSSSFLYRKFSIRIVMIYTGYLLATSLCTLSFFLYLNGVFPDRQVFSIVCLMCIIMNVVFFGLGLGPGPAIITGEMYPAEVRDIGGAMSGFVLFTSLSIIIKCMPYLFLLLHPSLIFLFFGCCTFSGVTVMWFVLPNTKDRTLKELETFYEDT